MCEGRRDRSALPALFARRSRAEPLLFLNAELRAARYRIAREAPEPCSRPPAPPVFSRSGSLWTRCLPLLFPSSPLCFIISARAWVCQAVEREMWGNVVMVDGYCSFCACANCICIPSWVINRDSTSAPLACANCIICKYRIGLTPMSSAPLACANCIRCRMGANTSWQYLLLRSLARIASI